MLLCKARQLQTVSPSPRKTPRLPLLWRLQQVAAAPSCEAFQQSPLLAMVLDRVRGSVMGWSEGWSDGWSVQNFGPDGWIRDEGCGLSVLLDLYSLVVVWA